MISYGRIVITIPGERYVWEPDEVTLGEQLLLENESGGTYDQWYRGIVRDEAVPWQILIWFLRRKEGRQEDRFSVDFPIRKADVERICGTVGCPNPLHVEITGEGDDKIEVRQPYCIEHWAVEPDPEALAGSEPATSSELAAPSGSDLGISID